MLFRSLIIGLGTTTSELEKNGVPPEQAQQVGTAVAESAGQVIPALATRPDGDVLVSGASEAFATAIKAVAGVAGVLVFLGLLTSFLLPKNASRVEGVDGAPVAEE